jgi:glutamate-ammonia-ligase adenylyltransferase
MRSTRARELLTEITPTLLAALGRTAQPDAALLRFDEFLRNLPAGVQLFSLFYSRPGLLDLVATIMGTAPRLAELLSHNVSLLDAVLGADFDAPLPGAAALARSLDETLAHARDDQDVLDLCRRWAHDRQFQVGVQTLHRDVAVEAGHAMLSDVAEAVLVALAPRVEHSFAHAHGRVPGGALAILGLGRLGGREMTATSDLDLVFVYAAAPGAEASDGGKPLPASQYFTRLAQRLLTALSALTAEGRLYEIDMRLRPSGAKGPVASEIEGFLRYQREEAWAWEHMALTRARLLVGGGALGERVTTGIGAVLRRHRDRDALAAEVEAMRGRIAAEHGTTDVWGVKHVRGGLIDIDFIAQYLQLLHAADAPEVLAPATVVALERLAAAGLLSPEDAGALTRAAILFQRVQGLLRLTLGTGGGAMPKALGELLAAATGTGDVDRLARDLADTEAEVRRCYERIVGSGAMR